MRSAVTWPSQYRKPLYVVARSFISGRSILDDLLGGNEETTRSLAICVSFFNVLIIWESTSEIGPWVGGVGE